MSNALKTILRTSAAALVTTALLNGGVGGVHLGGKARAEGAADPEATGASSEQAAAPIALIADKVEFDVDNGVVIATGGVEVFYDGRTLTADRIIYRDAEGTIEAAGAVTLRSGAGETVIADLTTLDADLRQGVIRSAQLLLADGAAKIAAVEGRRVEGRYNLLYKAVFSPCETCAERPVPLWRIRARTVLHDEVEQEIHYEDAYFDVLGVPVGYLPYFRHPSPEVERASGFLEPELSLDDAYGVGVKLPYYFVLGDHADLTVTPFALSGDGGLLETQYRREFEKGQLQLDLAFGVTNYENDGRGPKPRLGGFGFGEYEVDRGMFAGFNLAFATDDAFPRRYEYTDQDRLTTEAYLRAYDGRNFASLTTASIQSLRPNETEAATPFVTPEFAARYVLDTPVIGGEFGLEADMLGLVREDGRDVGRFSAGVDWSRQIITSPGLVFRGFGSARVDHYMIEDDAAFDDTVTRFAPRVGAQARMPFIKVTDGASHIVEPIIQIAAAPDDVDNGDIPNEDSISNEFEAANLFEEDRFAGRDRFETGVNFTAGARYGFTSEEISMNVAGGRIFRLTDSNDFTNGTGLDGRLSDYVLSFDATYDNFLTFRSDWRLSSKFDVNRAEFSATASYDRFSVFGAYLFVEEDPAAASPVDRSEMTFGGGVDLSRNWRLSADARYDPLADDFVTAGGALSYQDECAAIDIYAKRRFAESTDTPSSTSFGVRVRLFGAGGGDRSKASGVCGYGASY